MTDVRKDMVSDGCDPTASLSSRPNADSETRVNIASAQWDDGSVVPEKIHTVVTSVRLNAAR